MRNPFFNLPDFGGEFSDFRLALRLIVRQAFKPMHGSVATTTSSHTVAPYKKTFAASLKQSLRSTVRFISQTACLFQKWFKAGSRSGAAGSTNAAGSRRPGEPKVRTFTPPVAGTAITGKVINTLTEPPAKSLAKTINASAARGGKPVNAKRVASTNKRAGVNARRAANTKHGRGNAKPAANAALVTGNVGQDTPIVIHPVAQAPEKARDGMWVEYNKHAVVIARGSYVNNLKTGMWREYYDTGELMIEEHFLLGVQHGRFSTFHPNGQCCSDGRYEHGRREGQFFLYDESGRHVRSLTFKRDVLIEDVVIEERLAMA